MKYLLLEKFLGIFRLEMKVNPGYPVKKKNGNIKNKLTSVLKFDSVPILPPLPFDTGALIDYRFDRVTLTFQPQGLLQSVMHVEDIWSVKSKGDERSKIEVTSIVSTPYMLKSTTRRTAYKVINIMLDKMKRMAERDYERYIQESADSNLGEDSIQDTYIPGVSDGASAHDPESTPLGRRR
ncbi:DgyrCDS6303 [Dimorphilus gyrociliatus]|uniref:DgyrCDS6303 n=1 Tax=Dimorphilus gyrociliatus TaxID=2664684 RepID=A0A7I8VSF9_9ANNE|nr:DgyrCDS6303 [Dimorphilus gyrociliatus]